MNSLRLFASIVLGFSVFFILSLVDRGIQVTHPYAFKGIVAFVFLCVATTSYRVGRKSKEAE